MWAGLGARIRITYDPEADAIMITLRKADVSHTEEIQDGLYKDMDSNEQVIGIEILNASERMDDPRNVSFKLLGPGGSA